MKKLESDKAKWTANKARADDASATKVKNALAEKERLTNRTEEELENGKAARADQAAQQKKDSCRE
jgi:hypothetical protein